MQPDSTLCRLHTCSCGDFADCRGIHGLNCARSSGRLSTSFSSQWYTQKSFDPIWFYLSSRTTWSFSKHQYAPWYHDSCTMEKWKKTCNATCSDTIAPHNLGTINIPGGWCSCWEVGKTKAANIPDATEVLFQSLCSGNHGTNICAEGLELLTHLGRKLTSLTGERRSAFLFQQVGLAIQRGNAANLLFAPYLLE